MKIAELQAAVEGHSPLAPFDVTARALQVQELVDDEVIGPAVGAVYANNWSLILTRPDETIDQCGDRIIEATGPLNHADATLLSICEDLVGGLSASSAAAPRAQQEVRAWRRALETNRNLLGLANAAWLFQEVEGLGERVAADHQDVVEQFVQVPSTLREFVRVNVFIPLVLVRPLLRALIIGLDEAGGREVIDRIEVAKLLDPSALAVVPDYPGLMFYAGIREGRADRVQELATLVGIVQALVKASGVGPAAPARLSDRALPRGANISVMQGYRLYKQYLGLIGKLDDVYDAATGHALVRVGRAHDAAFSEKVRHALVPGECEPSGQPASR